VLPQVISRNVAARKIDSRYSGAYKSGSVAFVPDSISGLQVWLKADAITGLSDGDPVSTWEDSSTANHDATQALTVRPVYKTAILNGKAVVRFDGVNDRMDLGNLSAVFPSAATLFVVYTANTDTEYGVYCSESNNGFWRESSTGNGYISVFRTPRIAGYPTAMPSTGSHYVSVVSSAVDYQVWLDGVDAGVQAAGYEAGTFHSIGTDIGNGIYLDGDIAEVLVYDTALSAPNRTAVEAYLVAKYAL
jgi:hypothetical protein